MVHSHRRRTTEHQRRYNTQEAFEVEIILGVEGKLIEHHRDIIVQLRGVLNAKENMVLSNINVSQRSYVSLVYRMIFPFDEGGWNFYKSWKKSTYTTSQ